MSSMFSLMLNTTNPLRQCTSHQVSAGARFNRRKRFCSVVSLPARAFCSLAASLTIAYILSTRSTEHVGGTQHRKRRQHRCLRAYMAPALTLAACLPSHNSFPLTEAAARGPKGVRRKDPPVCPRATRHVTSSLAHVLQPSSFHLVTLALPILPPIPTSRVSARFVGRFVNVEHSHTCCHV